MEDESLKPKPFQQAINEITNELQGVKSWDDLVVELEKTLELAKYQRNLSRYEEVEMLIRVRKI